LSDRLEIGDGELLVHEFEMKPGLFVGRGLAIPDQGISREIVFLRLKPHAVSDIYVKNR